MHQAKGEHRINGQYILISLVAVLFTWLLDEFSHWLVGTLLGNDMSMTLNASYPNSGSYVGNWDSIIVSAAGPFVTLIQALIFYLLLKSNKNSVLFPFLLTCLYMGVIAAVLNIINLNDEGRVSRDLKLGVYTLPTIIVCILFYLTYKIIKAKGFSGKLVTLTTLLIMLFSSILVLSDQAFKFKII